MNVSIIIPFHGNSSFLSDCLESLSEQTYKDIETIIVCDHIKENINYLIKAYRKELNLVVYELEDKTGVAAARNLGIEKAKSEYIYFLDSDDYIYEDGLERLIRVVENSDTELDMVYGRKKGTWYKRNVFINTFRKDKETEVESEQDEEVDSMEDAQVEEGNGSEEILGEAETEADFTEASEPSEAEDLEEVEIDEEAVAQRRRNRAYTYLVSKKRGMKNISALHILYRKQFLDENHIRFDERFSLYADTTFVFEALQAVGGIGKDLKALYIKRRHNDPINFPAISQMKSEERFWQYIDVYYATIEKLPLDSTLRARLDKKVLNYFTNSFAFKLRRSKNESYRTDRFEAMRKLISGMDKERIRRLKKYKKRVVKALLKGDVKRATQVVNRHLAYRKFKRILKNKRVLVKYLYFNWFIKQPLKENVVLLESFFGKNYSDSPKYIYEYLSKNYPGKYKFVWVINKKHTQIPYKHIKIKRFGIRYAYYLAVSKYFVFNGRQPEWVKKREGNIFLETWHGTPLKRLVFDQEEVCGATPRYKEQVYKQSRLWDYLIAANQFSSDVFRSCFMYDKEMLEFGYPRNDIMHYNNKQEITDKIRERLNIPIDKKTILYAPTWRDDEFYAKGEYKFALQLDLNRMKAELGNEYIILLRTHYFIADALDVTGLEDFAFNLSKYDDISELYLISDILITDYSSVFFDYANLKRPMLFFTYDLDKYRDILRGFYIDMETSVPGPMLFTTEEVIDAIKSIDAITEEYKERYEEFYERFCSWENGHASENVVKRVFELE